MVLWFRIVEAHPGHILQPHYNPVSSATHWQLADVIQGGKLPTIPDGHRLPLHNGGARRKELVAVLQGLVHRQGRHTPDLQLVQQQLHLHLQLLSARDSDVGHAADGRQSGTQGFLDVVGDGTPIRVARNGEGEDGQHLGSPHQHLRCPLDSLGQLRHEPVDAVPHLGDAVVGINAVTKGYFYSTE